jgi:hypothetical protein
MVYAALSSGLDNFHDPKERLREWRELGAYTLAQNLLQSASLDWQSHRNTFWVNPWIAQHLREYDVSGLTYFVEQWLDRTPLPWNVSDDPGEEEAKVRHLKKLISALNR